MFSIDCFGMNGGNYLPSLSIHSQSHCLPSPSRISPRSPVSTSGSESGERYSRKVFVGGLPPDIDEGIVCFKRERETRISGVLSSNWESRTNYISSLLTRCIFFLLFLQFQQRKSMPVFVVSDRWWSTGLTRLKVNLTSHPKAMRFSCFK